MGICGAQNVDTNAGLNIGIFSPIDFNMGNRGDIDDAVCIYTQKKLAMMLAMISMRMDSM